MIMHRGYFYSFDDDSEKETSQICQKETKTDDKNVKCDCTESCFGCWEAYKNNTALNTTEESISEN